MFQFKLMQLRSRRKKNTKYTQAAAGCHQEALCEVLTWTIVNEGVRLLAEISTYPGHTQHPAPSTQQRTGHQTTSAPHTTTKNTAVQVTSSASTAPVGRRDPDGPSQPA